MAKGQGRLFLPAEGMEERCLRPDSMDRHMQISSYFSSPRANVKGGSGLLKDSRW